MTQSLSSWYLKVAEIERCEKLACKLEEREPGQIQKGKGKYTTWENNNNKSTYCLRQIWLIWNKIGDSQLGKTLKKIKNKLKSYIFPHRQWGGVESFSTEHWHKKEVLRKMSSL